MGLKWTSIFCQQAKFVLKTDDDIYVNLPLLHKAVTTEESFSHKIQGTKKLLILSGQCMAVGHTATDKL